MPATEPASALASNPIATDKTHYSFPLIGKATWEQLTAQAELSRIETVMRSCIVQSGEGLVYVLPIATGQFISYVIWAPEGDGVIIYAIIAQVSPEATLALAQTISVVDKEIILKGV